MRRTGKAIGTLAAATSLALLGGGLAFADQVMNDVASDGKVVEVEQGGTTSVAYSIKAQKDAVLEESSAACNAATSAVTVTPAVPAGISAHPTSLTFTSCDAPQSIVYSVDSDASTGLKAIPVSVGSALGYNVNPGRFDIDVLAASGSTDTTPPTVTCPTPEPVYILNDADQELTATVTDEEGGSGADAASGVEDVDTSALGRHAVSVTGTDLAGNDADAVSCYYTVRAVFTGTNAAINGGGATKAKAGSAVPLKFTMTDANGDAVLGLTEVAAKVVNLNCSSVSAVDAEAESAAGSSGLQDLGEGHYQWNWKTPSTYANSCRQLTLTVAGHSGTGSFTFTK